MLDVLLDALIDTVKIIPILYLVYLLIEYFLHRKREKFLKTIAGTKKTGPLIATALGLIPQCGFSAVMADFYSKRYITIGSLIAIFIATSDEAIILMFSDYKLIPSMLLLLLLKAVIAIIVGYIIDLCFKKRAKQEILAENLEKDIKNNRHCACDHEHIVEDEHIHHHEHIHDEDCNCCTSHIFLHALKHTVEIALFVLVANIILGLLIEYLGVEKIVNFIKTGTILEPLISVVIGLIPNCFASVMLVELYASGIISFASLLGGLCVGAGVGLLVLFKNNKHILENMFIVLILILTGFLVGCVGLLL